MMSGGQAAPCHVRRPRRRSPLVRVESGGLKQIKRRRRVTPLAALKRRHVEMQEHAETQIYKSLLQIKEWPPATQACRLRLVLVWGGVTPGEHRNRGRLSGQPEKLSSCRHLQCLDRGLNSRTNRK